MSTDASGRGRVRASDAEREQYATILRAAMTEGRLNLEEGEERLAKAYAATYRDELDPLTADLPDGGRRALFDTPEMRAAFRRGARNRALLIASVAALLIGLSILTGGHFVWLLIPLAFLVFGPWRRRWYGWHGGWQGGGQRGGPVEHRPAAVCRREGSAVSLPGPAGPRCDSIGSRRHRRAAGRSSFGEGRTT